MSEMIERVAKVLEAMDPHTGQGYMDEKHRPTARAAIEAMREPTEDMVVEGYCQEYALTHKMMVEAYQAMIDEALKDGG